MGTIKEQRDQWLEDRGLTPASPEQQLFLVRALLGLNPDQETVTGVRLLMQMGREKFAEQRGPRYDVLTNQFSEWKPTPGLEGEQLPLV